MNIFIANLNFKTTDDELHAAFAVHGAVRSAKVITDRETGRSKGFGFVEMPNAEEAAVAIREMNGCRLDGRALVCNEARPRENGKR